MPPAALFPGLGEHLTQCLPEPEGAVADREDRGPHAAAFARAEQVGPRLRALAEAVGERDQLLGPVGADPDDHQQAHLVLLEADLEVDAVDPAIDVVDLLQGALVERGRVVMPLRGEPGDRRRRQTGRGAEELLQRRTEVRAGQAVQEQSPRPRGRCAVAMRTSRMPRSYRFVTAPQCRE